MTVPGSSGFTAGPGVRVGIAISVDVAVVLDVRDGVMLAVVDGDIIVVVVGSGCSPGGGGATIVGELGVAPDIEGFASWAYDSESIKTRTMASMAVIREE